MKILPVLTRTLELVESSRTSSWAPASVEQLAAELRAFIAEVESGTFADRDGLRGLFGPTGPLQETSIDNGWGDEFLSLAQRVDAFLAD